MRSLNGLLPAVVTLAAAYGVVACSSSLRRTEAEGAADAGTTPGVEAALTEQPERHL